MIKIDPSKMITDTTMLLFTLSELGCYLRLQCHCWQAGKLPTDTLSLARLAGCSVGQFQDVWPKVSRFFEETDDGHLTCPAIEQDRRKAKKQSDRMRKVANARWGKKEVAA
jgi:uncharacterized protein YdaU (DUF1376 family)